MNTVNDSVVNQASGVDKTYSTINLMMEKIKGLNQSVEVQTAGSTQVLQSISEIKNSADVVKNNSDRWLQEQNR